jgi:RHS repeat-associated protein
MRVDDVVELHAQAWLVSIDLPIGGTMRLHHRAGRAGGPDPTRAGLGGWLLTPHHLLDPTSRTVHTGSGQTRQSVGLTPGGPSTPVPSVGGELLCSSGAGTTWHVFDDAGRPLRTVSGRTGAILWQFEHDGEGLLAGVVDRDATPVVSIERRGESVELRGPGPVSVVLQIDLYGRTSMIATSDGASITTAFDDVGNLVEVVDPAGRVRRATFDDERRLSSIDRPAGPSFSLVRRHDGNTTTLAKIDPDGREARYVTERLPDGTLRRSTWCCGGEEPAVRERLGGQSTLTRPDGTVVRRTTTRTPTQSTVSRRLELPSGLASELSVTRTTDPSTGATTRTTVVNGRTYSGTVDPDGSVTLIGPDQAQTAWTVDSVGRPQTMEAPTRSFSMHWDEAGQIAGISDGHATLSAGYDSHGRLDHLAVAGIETWLEHDPEGRVVAQRWADGRQVDLEYGPAGDLLAVSPPGRPPTRFEYVDRGATSAIVLPEVDGATAVQRFERDGSGTPTTMHRADGTEVRLERDARGWTHRVVGADVEIGYERSPADGRLRAITSHGITTRFTWDGHQRTAVEVDGPAPSTITCSWDADRRPEVLSVTGAEPVRRRWDAAGRPVVVGALAIEREAASGAITERRLGRCAELRTVDSGRITRRWIVLDGEEVVAEERSFDEHGRLAAVTTRVGGVLRTESYRRDAAGRLAGYEIDGASTEWTYDLNGNRRSTSGPAGSEALAVDDRDRLIRWGDRIVQHLPDGELSGWTDDAGATSVHHDVLGRLVELALPDGRTVHHTHDGRGLRLATRHDDTTVGRWAWWAPGIPTAELDEAGLVVRSFVGDGTPGSFEYVVDHGRLVLVVADVQGSPRWFVDAATGEIVADLGRDPWGAPTDDAPPVGPFGFLAGMTDGATPTVTIGARHLIAGLGRWTTADPLRYRGGDTNWYAYALGDPIERADRTGTKVELCRRTSTDGALAAIGADHVWIRTDSAEAGMGGHPFESTAIPFTDRVAVKDHTGEGDSGDGAECEEVPDADEECVNEAIATPNDVGDLDPRGAGIKYGKDLGTWGPTNTCQTFAEEVLQSCGSNYTDDAWDPGSTPPSETEAYDGGMSEAPADDTSGPGDAAADHTPDPGYTPADQGSDASSSSESSSGGSAWE